VLRLVVLGFGHVYVHHVAKAHEVLTNVSLACLLCVYVCRRVCMCVDGWRERVYW
jgi:methyl coenzyme M reductase subunit C